MGYKGVDDAVEFFQQELKDAFEMASNSSGSINSNPIAASLRNAVSNTIGFFMAPGSAVGRTAMYAATHGKGNPGSMKGMIESAVGADEGAMTNFWVGREAATNEAGEVLKNADGSVQYKNGTGMHLNGAKIAALGSGLGIGYRFLSGGGIYRDKDGNTDIAGIPFV